MNPQSNRPPSHMTAIFSLLMFLLAVLSLGAVIQAHDPVGLLGWLFCFAAALTAGNPTPQTDPQIR